MSHNVPRIHILGVGSIGILIAHSLRCVDPPPRLTLLFHRPGLVDEFALNRNTTYLINKNANTEDERSGYEFEILEAASDQRAQSGRRPWSRENLNPEKEFIEFLIVSCKGPATCSALEGVRHRMTAKSTICLMQNGMGQVEELNGRIFTEPDQRPAYVLGILSHGLYLEKAFRAVHAGVGTIALGVARDLTQSSRADIQSKASSNCVCRVLQQAPNIHCTIFDYEELVQLQLEKLLVNCILNPLSALLDVCNGAMLNNPALSQIQTNLVAEISEIIQALPELKGNPATQTRFSPGKLVERFISVVNITAANSSSMREDVRNNRETEVDYINGYIIKRGKELGIKCPTNELVLQLVKGKTFASRNSEIIK